MCITIIIICFVFIYCSTVNTQYHSNIGSTVSVLPGTVELFTHRAQIVAVMFCSPTSATNGGGLIVTSYFGSTIKRKKSDCFFSLFLFKLYLTMPYRSRCLR